jgi:hypothetical protein
MHHGLLGRSKAPLHEWGNACPADYKYDGTKDYFVPTKMVANQKKMQQIIMNDDNEDNNDGGDSGSSILEDDSIVDDVQ